MMDFKLNVRLFLLSYILLSLVIGIALLCLLVNAAVRLFAVPVYDGNEGITKLECVAGILLVFVHSAFHCVPIVAEVRKRPGLFRVWICYLQVTIAVLVFALISSVFLFDWTAAFTCSFAAVVIHAVLSLSEVRRKEMEADVNGSSRIP